MQTKTEIRTYIAEKKVLFPLEKKENSSKIIIAQVEALPEFISASCILCYHSLPDEVNTHTFIEKWAKEKTILLPVVQNDTLAIRKYEQKTTCKPGPFQILEPVGDNFLDYKSIDLILLPGVAFDKKGNRLGRGKGYYDKLLTRIPGLKIGICFEFQLVDAIPADKWDIPVNRIITEKTNLVTRLVKP